MTYEICCQDYLNINMVYGLMDKAFIPARDFCLKKKKFAVEIQKLPPPVTATDKTSET